jgi:hypothetical protein
MCRMGRRARAKLERFDSDSCYSYCEFYGMDIGTVTQIQTISVFGAMVIDARFSEKLLIQTQTQTIAGNLL